jgi:succinate dehydrogenase / fumarate reductase iron-sulfur subunit
MDEEGFGACSNITACGAECPKEISVEYIAKLNRDYLSSSLGSEKMV